MDLPVPDTDLGRLFAATDWGATPLGPIDSWPSSLRTAAGLCLASRFPIFLWWGPELVMVYNDAYRPMLGETKHPQALGRPGREVWPEIWDVIGPMLDGVMAGGGATWSDDQLLFIDRNGLIEEAYFTFSYSPIHEDDGLVGGVFCAVTETTSRVLTERRSRTKAALAAALVGVRSTEDVRRRAEESLRANSSDHAAVEVLPPGAALPAGAGEGSLHVVEVLEPGRATPSGHLVLTANPQRPWDDALQVYAELCAAHIASALTAVRRIDDERVRLEALAQLDAAKSDFFANVSHELRTPLALVAGPVSDLLGDVHDPLSPAHRTRLELVERNVDRLRLLVDEVLDLSRVEAGVVQARHVETDVQALVRGLAASFEPAIERAGLAFTLSCTALPRPAYVDPDMVERIVLNLLSNALRYTPEGAIEVRLRAVADGFEVVVSDTGIGIPEEGLELVFERFRQLPRADRRRAREGTGIGLYLVRQLTELQGGHVGVASVVGQGSTFTVFLPYGEPAAGESGLPSLSPRPAESFVAEADAWSRRDTPQGAGTRDRAASAVVRVDRPNGSAARSDGPEAPLPVLLLVEDNADLREYLASILENDYEVVTAGDGLEGLERARALRPDLILSDVMMPGVDGLELVRELRADAHLRDVPVVLLSARAGVEASASGFDHGADDYVVKPFEAAELRSRLAANLARARGRSRDTAWRRAVLAALREPLVIADRDGNILEMNEAFTRTYGWDLADGPISPPYPWWVDPEEDREERDWAVLGLERLQSGLPSFDETFRLRRRNGSDVWVSVAAAGVPDASDHPGFLLGTFRDETRERESRFRRSLAARLAVELAKAEDLEQVLSSAVTGFSVLFDGEATVRVAVGRRDVVFTPSGLTPLGDLSPAMRDRMAGDVDQLAEASSGARQAEPGAHRRVSAPEPVPGLLLAPAGADAECRAWVQFHEPRVVPSDELVVGDLLGLAFAQAVDRVAARQDRAQQEQHFQRAVESHRLIGHAVGILIERHKVTAAQGFEMLRQASLNRNIKLRELATRVIETGMEPSDTV
ncbi:hypothetical protein N865_05535 [Intrasporangium oryzae NRRL B-24470]|uniref:histidine kinase n=1 Tax=Intrasporangium oryzae NRRL B-24470 TaxID=1386089 RepID=W9GBK1_9MICO|nr:ATP-binding protein [Intrasporangium oryzae]EWT01244.1 hypothetical protein N865_05535 [Intrasporangium oryzae NRRL B-24470]